MSFVFRTPKSQYWIAGFIGKDGRRHNRSTRATNRKQAEKIAAEYEEAAKKRRTARQVRAVILSLHQDITGEVMNSATVRGYFDEWLVTKSHECKPATNVFYKSAAKKFLEWLGAKADGEIADVGRADVLAFRNAENGKLAPKTVNHGLKFVRMVFKSAKRDGLISDNPAEEVDSVRLAASKLRRPFTIPELQAVLSVADDEWRSMILFAFYSGQRLSDIALLTWENLDLVRDELRLVTGKTDRTIMIPLPAPLRRHALNLPSADTPAAPIHPRACATVERGGKASHLSNQFGRLLAEAGLRAKSPHRKKGAAVPRQANALSFHSLRATATTLLHEAGIPASVAQALIGHDSAEIHQDYVKVGREALRHAADSMPEIWPNSQT